MGTTTEIGIKTEVFTKEELEALRKALNEGRNGTGDYSPPPSSGQENEFSDDWRNDCDLLGKFLNDLVTVLDTLTKNRIPETNRKRFAGMLENVRTDMDQAIQQLKGIDDPKDSLLDKLKNVGLLGESLLAKLDEFRDRIGHGPVLAVLGMGDVILGSLAGVLHVLEPLKELKETIENRIEYGGDDEIIKLGL